MARSTVDFRSRSAEQRDDFARFNVKGDVADGVTAAVAVGKALNAETLAFCCFGIVGIKCFPGSETLNKEPR